MIGKSFWPAHMQMRPISPRPIKHIRLDHEMGAWSSGPRRAAPRDVTKKKRVAVVTSGWRRWEGGEPAPEPTFMLPLSIVTGAEAEKSLGGRGGRRGKLWGQRRWNQLRMEKEQRTER